MRLTSFISSFVIMLFSIVSTVLSAQDSTALTIDTIDRVLVLNNYDVEDGFLLYLPLEECEDSTLNLVVFVHGFGALNPMVYGGWIEHLVTQGNAVLFPRYQMSIFSTSTDDFVPNTVAAIRTAYGLVAQYGYQLNDEYIDLIGHSYGGVIIGNIAATCDDHNIPAPRLALLCEPGAGPFSGAVLDSYDGIDNDILLAIIVGDEDHTVGQKLGLIVYETAVNAENRILFWQYADENKEESIGASHYEPYSYDKRFDVGIENFTISRAEKVSSLDQVDHHGYWQIFDSLQGQVNFGKVAIDTQLIEKLSDMGEWSDGTHVRPMEWRVGGK